MKSVIGRIAMAVFGLVLLLIGMSMLTDEFVQNATTSLIAKVVVALGCAVIAAAVLPGEVKLGGDKMGAAKLNVQAAGPIAIFVLLLGAMLFTGETKTATPQAVASQPQAGGNGGTQQPSVILVRSYCSATDVEGFGQSTTYEIAREIAISNCVANGGLPECCPNNVNEVR